LSAHAVGPAHVRAIRHLDLAVLALTLPVFLATGLPLLGWGAVAAVWLAQRAIHDLFLRRARAAGDPTRTTALLAISMVGRVWLIALAVFAAGIVEREAGLSAAVLSVALMTSYLAAAMATGGPLGRPGLRR
jgi:hypothetical protein